METQFIPKIKILWKIIIRYTPFLTAKDIAVFIACMRASNSTFMLQYYLNLHLEIFKFPLVINTEEKKCLNIIHFLLKTDNRTV